jgi:hypothetical protein
MVDFGDIWEVLKLLAKADGIAAIHAENNDIVMPHVREAVPRRAEWLREHGRGA